MTKKIENIGFAHERVSEINNILHNAYLKLGSKYIKLTLLKRLDYFEIKDGTLSTVRKNYISEAILEADENALNDIVEFIYGKYIISIDELKNLEREKEEKNKIIKSYYRDQQKLDHQIAEIRRETSAFGFNYGY